MQTIYLILRNSVDLKLLDINICDRFSAKVAIKADALLRYAEDALYENGGVQPIFQFPYSRCTCGPICLLLPRFVLATTPAAPLGCRCVFLGSALRWCRRREIGGYFLPPKRVFRDIPIESQRITGTSLLAQTIHRRDLVCVQRSRTWRNQSSKPFSYRMLCVMSIPGIQGRDS